MGYLVLNRKAGESIRINDDIEIKIVGIQGAKFRIAIDAPKDVRVHRGEVYDKIKKGEANGEA